MNQRTWLTMAVERARSGLRADVQKLIEAIPTSQLIVPLARPLPGFGEGERRQVMGGLSITPNLLRDSQGHLMLPVFTYEEPVARFAAGWKTEGAPLKVATLPASFVLDLADRMVDGTRIVRMVFDAAAPSELGLRREEIVAVREGRPIPLVEYTRALPRSPVLAETGPPPELVEAVRRCVALEPSILACRVERWFDPERDLEPRLVITARVTRGADQQFLADSIGVAARDLLHGHSGAEVHFETEGA